MEKEQNISDLQRTLRESAAQYLPETMETVESQRKLLQLLAEVILPVSVCMSKAERDYWPQVEKKELPLEKAVQLCAMDVNNIIRITVVENLNLEGVSEEGLLKTWAVVGYYCEQLEGKNAAHIQKFHNRLTGILREKMEMRQKVEELAAMISAMEQLEEETTDSAKEGSVEKDNTGEAQDVQTNTTGKKKGKLALLLIPAVAAILALVLVLMPMLSKVSQVEKAIEAIGVVSLSSEEAIAAAEESYSQLTPEKQAEVENYGLLLEARATYECLVVADAIDAIGQVTLESESAILYAEELYDALSQELQGRVENYKNLTAARKSYNQMKIVVDNAVKTIDAIGTVSLTSGDKINTARKAYDNAVREGVGSYVANKEKTLTTAEETYMQLVTKDLYDSGKALYDQGSYEEALEKFLSLAVKYPSTTAGAEAKELAQDCRMILAENACKKSDLYTAMKLLDQMDKSFAQAEEVKTLRQQVLDKLSKARPKNGHKFADKTGWGWCELKVTAAKQDMCVKIISVDNPANYLMFYVRAGETTEMSIQNGEYTIVFTTGEHWYSKDIGFGDGASYQRTTGQLSLTSWRSGSYVYYYKYELNLAVPGQSDFNLNACSANDFWG